MSLDPEQRTKRRLSLAALAGAASVLLLVLIATRWQQDPSSETPLAQDDRAIAGADASVRLTMAGPAKRFVGRPIEYEIAISVVGEGPHDVALEAQLADGTTFVGATHGGAVVDADGGVVAWPRLPVVAGRSETIGLVCNATAAGRMTCTARARLADDDGASASWTTEASGIAALLLEVVDIGDRARVGDESTYVIDVTNQGFAAATNVVLECTLPTDQEYVSATSEAASEAHNDVLPRGREIAFPAVPSVAAGERITYRVTVRTTAPSNSRLRARLRSDQLARAR